MNNPKIVQVELTPVLVPFKEQIRQFMAQGEGGLGMAIPAEEAWLGGDFVICRMTCDDGSIGISEAYFWLPETAVTANQIIDVIKIGLARYVLGESPFNIERICDRMNRNVPRNEVAKGLLDMACYDLMGQITSRPVYDLIGGRVVEELPLTALIPLTDVETMLALAKMYLKEGFQTIRLKLGKGPTQDAVITEAVRDLVGPSIPIRVDYNQAYRPAEAVRAIKAIERFGIQVAEQPVRVDDFLGMAYVQRRVSTPLMAHEGFFSLKDFIILAKLRAVGILGVNTERPGGLTNALKAISYAEQLGMPVILHNQPLGINSAVQTHLAAARYNALGLAMELTGHLMLEDDLIVNPMPYKGGSVKVPTGPGWGVKLDEKALGKYQTAPPLILK
jgi:muconate cycloisomerase